MTISESYGLLCTFDYMLFAFRVCDKRVNESAGSRKNSKLKSFPPRTRQREEKSFLPIFHSQLTVRELQLTLDIRRERISFSSREWFIWRRKNLKWKIMKSIELILLFAISALCTVTAQNYCENSLCSGRQHVGCRNSGVRLMPF